MEEKRPHLPSSVKSDVAFKPFALVTFIWAQMKVTRLPGWDRVPARHPRQLQNDGSARSRVLPTASRADSAIPPPIATWN
jgi:hypothetical protein